MAAAVPMLLEACHMILTFKSRRRQALPSYAECRDPEGKKGCWVFRRSLPHGFAWFVLIVGGSSGAALGLLIAGIAIWRINRPDKASANGKPHYRSE
jgi:hypothetical protein